MRWFNKNRFPDATRNALADALIAVAHQSIISPVRHYLEELHWDGQPRIGTWLTIYCGAADTTFVGAAGQAWLISAVARALDPGCKADCALILEGPQGAGKSSALRTLAGPAWFFDGLRDFASKDASSGLRGKWIIELPELAAMRRTDVELVKAFLSRSEERYRPPTAATRCSSRAAASSPAPPTAATTSPTTPATAGSGRSPVGTIDLDALARDRDQLWAEAVHAFRGGAPWWLSRRGWRPRPPARRPCAPRTTLGPARCSTGSQGSPEVSTKEILVDALGIRGGDDQGGLDARRGHPAAARVAARRQVHRPGATATSPATSRCRRRGLSAEPPCGHLPRKCPCFGDMRNLRNLLQRCTSETS